jgi:hypothetical protein
VADGQVSRERRWRWLAALRRVLAGRRVDFDPRGSDLTQGATAQLAHAKGTRRPRHSDCETRNVVGCASQIGDIETATKFGSPPKGERLAVVDWGAPNLQRLPRQRIRHALGCVERRIAPYRAVLEPTIGAVESCVILIGRPPSLHS